MVRRDVAALSYRVIEHRKKSYSINRHNAAIPEMLAAINSRQYAAKYKIIALVCFDRANNMAGTMKHGYARGK